MFEEIIKYLEDNNIHVLDFNDCKDNIYFLQRASITIDLSNQIEGNWGYFVKKIDNEGICKAEFKDHIVRFEFTEIDNKLLKKDLDLFLTLLKKRYYEVNPKRESFSLLVKPTHRCNLDCKYCYDKPFRDAIKTDMSFETLDRLLYLLSRYAEHVDFIWHGGEATMMGIDWYERAYQEVFIKYPMIDFDFSVMSNGVIIDEKWMNLFHKYNIGVGVSYNAMFQENLRVTSQDKGSLGIDKVRSDSIYNLVVDNNKKHTDDKTIGVIDVITNLNYKNQIDIYEFYKDIRTGVSMNPIFHTKNTEKNNLDMKAEDYLREYKKYFRYWVFDANGMYERSIMESVALIFSDKGRTCVYTDCRKNWIGVNPLGDVYPCDRFYPEMYRAGNIRDFNSIEDIFSSEGYQRFYKDVQKKYDDYCSKCDIFFTCHGGCNANSVELFGDATKVDDFYCEVTKEQFRFAYDILRSVDSINDDNINPALRQYILQNGIYTVKDIKNFLEDNNIDIDLEYNPNDLLNCSEYKLFRFINRINCSCDCCGHVDSVIDPVGFGIDSYSKKYNKDRRDKDLKERIFIYFKDMVENELDSDKVEYLDNILNKMKGRVV